MPLLFQSTSDEFVFAVLAHLLFLHHYHAGIRELTTLILYDEGLTGWSSKPTNIDQAPVLAALQVQLREMGIGMLVTSAAISMTRALRHVRLRALRVEQAALHSRALHLRRSDLRHLKWSSVGLQQGVIRLIMRKTKRPVLLPIVPRVRAALDACRKRTVMSECVLVTPEGRPYAESTIKRYFKTAKALAGITRRFRFHDQRLTVASTLASKGINSFTLRDLLGHTSTRTTERYARPSTEALDAVIRALA